MRLNITKFILQTYVSSSLLPHFYFSQNLTPTKKERKTVDSETDEVKKCSTARSGTI